MQVDWTRFCEVIHASNNVVLTSHIRPDCDALGSCLGMAGLLESLGKKVRIVCGQEVPGNLAFIDPENRIKCIGKDITAEEFADADLHIILDTSAWIQLGDMAEVIKNSTYKKIIFDHHEGEDDIDAELFKNTTAEAVGRMIVEAAEHLGVEMTPEIAQPVLAALATDTGWFRFGSVNPGTFRATARLLEAGANQVSSMANCTSEKPLAEFDFAVLFWRESKRSSMVAWRTRSSCLTTTRRQVLIQLTLKI